MVYQGFKVFRRNPISYNPRALGSVFLAYFGYSIYKNYTIEKLSNIEYFNEPNSHCY